MNHDYENCTVCETTPKKISMAENPGTQLISFILIGHSRDINRIKITEIPSDVTLDIFALISTKVRLDTWLKT